MASTKAVKSENIFPLILKDTADGKIFSCFPLDCFCFGRGFFNCPPSLKKCFFIIQNIYFKTMLAGDVRVFIEKSWWFK